MVVYPKKQPLTSYHLRAKINMGYVWDGCVGTECENVCGQTLANCKLVITVCH